MQSNAMMDVPGNDSPNLRMRMHAHYECFNAQLELQAAPAMKIHSLALSLLLLTLFTLSSVVLFEIFTTPPVYVRQKHQVFITFASDYQWSDDNDKHGVDSNLHHPANSLEWTSSRGSHVHVVSAQGVAMRGSSITSANVKNHASGDQQAAQGSPSMSPSWVSKSNSKTDNPKDTATDTDRISRAVKSIIPKPVQPEDSHGMQTDANDAPYNSTSLVRRMKYINKKASSVSRMQVPKPGKTLYNRYTYKNRSITKLNAMDYKKHINHPAGPGRSGLQCTDSHCTSYLLDEDYWSFVICQQWTEKKTMISHFDINATCKFTKGVTREPVALVSIPGSGNTWVRELLETATGICTGSIYCDHPLRNAGMIGEYVKTGRVLVVKTHTSDYQWNEATLETRNEDDALYGSAILLIRNPFKAFIAEWNRLNAFNTYHEFPIGPTIRVTNTRLNRTSLLSFANNAKLYKEGILNKRQRPPMSLLSKKNRWIDMMKRNSRQNDSGGQYGSVLPVGRKLLSMVNKKAEDVSHTIEIDRKMFGEYYHNHVCTILLAHIFSQQCQEITENGMSTFIL